ncbi:MAG: hypothetical protein ACTSRA_16570 [Promethearchaeota archaeon]
MLEGFLSKKYKFPEIAGKKVLILGIGGGCDVISAYSLQFLFNDAEKAEILYGNTKRTIDPDLTLISRHIGRLPPEKINIKTFRMKGCTTKIDRSIPRGKDGCLYIFQYVKQEEGALVDEIKQLNPDLIFRVDTGGDSIIFGAKSGPGGRDRRMVKILKRTGIPSHLVILAPGSDGESKFENIIGTFQVYRSRNQYLGCFSLAPLVPRFKEFTSSLREKRTINIIVKAFEGTLEVDENGFFLVPREIMPWLPRDLLIHGFVFINFNKA